MSAETKADVLFYFLLLLFKSKRPLDCHHFIKVDEKKDQIESPSFRNSNTVRVEELV